MCYATGLHYRFTSKQNSENLTETGPKETVAAISANTSIPVDQKGLQGFHRIATCNSKPQQ